MDFKSYVQSVVQSYVEKQNRNVIFIKHYNTLDISKEELLARVQDSGDKVFLYHEYAMHSMHPTYDPFLQWISQCYEDYYKDRISVEDFLRECHVYSLHVEPLADYIRSRTCHRKEDVLYFEIQYESYRMLQSIISILQYISKEHHLILILCKFHLAPYSTIQLFRSFIEQSVGIHAILMYNDEFLMADYKKGVWSDLLQSAADQNLQLEWGSMNSERTMDVQDEFLFDKSSAEDYLLRLRNMIYTFSLQDANYYVGNIMNRIEEKTIRLKQDQYLRFLALTAMIDMNLRQVNHALVLCDKMISVKSLPEMEPMLRYSVYYVCARAKMIASQTKEVEKYCQKCVEIAEELEDKYLACRAEVILWSTYCSFGREFFEYDFNYRPDPKVVEKVSAFGFRNFLAYYYVFSYENESETIRAIADGTKKPYYFDLGIRIGTELGNDNFLLHAYMKNIVLYSRAGYHRLVREMYIKRLAVLRKPNPLRESHMLAGLGYNSIILEDFETAHKDLRQSVLNLTELEAPDDVMNSLYNLAMNYFVAENYQCTVTTIELIIKMLKEMGYHSITACSTIKLYALIAAGCYYLKEYYNSYYYLSKMELIVEHMVLVLKTTSEDSWDEDLLLYHLIKGMLYNYENNDVLCQKEFDVLKGILKTAKGARFFAVPLYTVEQASLYLKQGNKEKSDEVLAEGIRFCEKEGLPRKKQRLEYYARHGVRMTEPIFSEEASLPVGQLMQMAKHAGTQIKLRKRDKDIRFLTVLQETLSRENMNLNELYQSTSAVIKNSYSLDEIMILRRMDGKRKIMRNGEASVLSDEEFDNIFSFFQVYKLAFLVNRSDKNFNQFLSVMTPFDEKPITTMIGIPIFEESGYETIFLAYVRVKRRTVGERVPLNGNDLMILKFAFSQFCETMRRIDNRIMIESMNRQLEQSAVTDHLTGISNRNGLSRQADWIINHGSGQNNVMLYLDLDNFKFYNDTFGHEIGDLVLISLAEIFKRMTENKGFAVRYGGDEFIILLYNKTTEEGAAFAERIYLEIKDGFVERIQKKLHKAIVIPEDKKISCSIGIAGFKGGSREEFETALNHADQTLYYVKRHGKSRYEIFGTNIMNEKKNNESTTGKAVSPACFADETASFFA